MTDKELALEGVATIEELKDKKYDRGYDEGMKMPVSQLLREVVTTPAGELAQGGTKTGMLDALAHRIAPIVPAKPTRKKGAK